jgi:arylsulfatase A-like enzyme
MGAGNRRAHRASRQSPSAPFLAWVPFGVLIIAASVGILAGEKPAGDTSLDERKQDPGDPAEGAAGSARNLIIISIDTLRADRLGCYGYGRPTSPNIDALAGRGLRFANVIAESPWTLPSHMSLFTGLHPSSHGVYDAKFRLAEKIPTMAEVLKIHGFRTFGYTGGGFVSGRFGFSRGFEIYQENKDPIRVKARDLRSSLDAASQKIGRLGSNERYFLFVHTYDVHCPYHPPSEYSLMFATRPLQDRLETAGFCDRDFNRRSLTSGQIHHISDQYDAGIRAADEDIARFVRRLGELGAFEDTVFVLTSDHGEELKEHGRIGHTHSLHAELLKIPLIILAPGVEPDVVEEGAGLVDLMPTLLDLLGIEAPPSQGRSLVAFMAGGQQDRLNRPLYSELDRFVQLRSVVRGRHHLIAKLVDEERWLYDLKTDPAEQTNLAGRGHPDERGLAAMLREHFAAMPRRKELPRPPPTPDELEKLRSLGYLDG